MGQHVSSSRELSVHDVAFENVSFGKKPKGKPKRGTAGRTHPELWARIVKQVKAGNKGGRPGQWSARKAQLAVHRYKKAGGGYTSPKSRDNSLAKWTRQEWRTKSGKNSVMGKGATGERYLPAKAIQKLTKKEYSKTTAAKRRALKRGKQFAKQPRKIAKKTKRYRR